MQKTDRQNKILSVIAAKPIARQDEIAKLLRKNGFSVTQASISRDLDEIGVVKVNGYYSLPQRTTRRDAFGFKDVSPAGDALIVAKCSPGLASAVAAGASSAFGAAFSPVWVGSLAPLLKSVTYQPLPFN